MGRSSKKLCKFILIFLIGFTLLSVLLLHLLLIICVVFDAILSNIDEVFSINPTAVFVFGDFNVYHKDWLTCSSETNRPGELFYNLK